MTVSVFAGCNTETEPSDSSVESSDVSSESSEESSEASTESSEESSEASVESSEESIETSVESSEQSSETSTESSETTTAATDPITIPVNDIVGPGAPVVVDLKDYTDNVEGIRKVEVYFSGISEEEGFWFGGTVDLNGLINWEFETLEVEGEEYEGQPVTKRSFAVVNGDYDTITHYIAWDTNLETVGANEYKDAVNMEFMENGTGKTSRSTAEREETAMITNGRLVMTGDSITDCGRRYPQDGTPDSRGWGYVSYVNAYVRAFRPELSLEILNTGISGNTTADLCARWQTDVLDLKPDYVTLMIGVNDVWRKYDGNPQAHVPADRYRENLRHLIEQTIPHVREMYLLTPYFLEVDPEDPMRKDVDAYAQIVQALSEQYRLPLVDIRKEFLARLETSPYTEWSLDRVHPNHVGHMVIARQVLEKTGLR